MENNSINSAITADHVENANENTDSLFFYNVFIVFLD